VGSEKIVTKKIAVNKCVDHFYGDRQPKKHMLNHNQHVLQHYVEQHLLYRELFLSMDGGGAMNRYEHQLNSNTFESDKIKFIIFVGNLVEIGDLLRNLKIVLKALQSHLKLTGIIEQYNKHATASLKKL